MSLLLKHGGVPIFLVPISLNADAVEHFPDLNNCRLVEIGGRRRLEKRTATGLCGYATAAFFSSTRC
jgi:hypothetical protein